MNKPLIAAALVPALALATWQALRAMAPAETRIRRLLDACVSDFNDRAGLSIMSPFAGDYEDTTTGLDRQTLQQILLYVFQRNVDKKSKQFLFRLEMPPDDIAITVADTTATADFVLRLHRGTPADEEIVWKLRVHTDLVERDGDWLFHRSRHETLEGARPAR